MKRLKRARQSPAKGESVKKATPNRRDQAGDDMLPEYDFSTMAGGQRGKYAKAYRAGHTITIRHSDGSVTVRRFPPEDGVVLLEPAIGAFSGLGVGRPGVALPDPFAAQATQEQIRAGKDHG